MCFEWSAPGSSWATVFASNYVFDEISFTMLIHPDDYIITYQEELFERSGEIFQYDLKDIVEEVLPQATMLVNAWWLKVGNCRQWVSPSIWKTERGVATPDIHYASLAFLYSVRTEMSGERITEMLAKDMQVSESTAKERVRKARDKAFLTSPGKGLRGQGEVTKKATRILTKKGLINAKKSE
jgi:hypothetical protein